LPYTPPPKPDSLHSRRAPPEEAVFALKVYDGLLNVGVL